MAVRLGYRANPAARSLRRRRVAAYQAWCAAGGYPPLLYDVPIRGAPEAVRDAAARALRARTEPPDHPGFDHPDPGLGGQP